MVVPQTVSPELPERDFGQNPGLRRAVLASQLKDGRANARKLAGYLRRTWKSRKEQDWLAEEIGNKLRLAAIPTSHSAPVSGQVSKDRLSTGRCSLMLILQTVSPELGDRDFRGFVPQFGADTRSLYFLDRKSVV